MTVYLGDKAVGVNTVVEKEVAKTKFGATIDAFLGGVDADGNYIVPTEDYVLDLTGVKSVPSSAFEGFAAIGTNTLNPRPRALRLYKIIANDITKCGQSSFYYCCYYNDSLESVSFDSIETVPGACFASTFTYVEQASFASLKIVESGGFQGAFSQVRFDFDKVFPSLITIIGNYAMSGTGYSKSGERMEARLSKVQTIRGGGGHTTSTFAASYVDVFLPRCTQISGYISRTNYNNTLHLAAANQAAIEACDGYSYKFGVSEIYFDLMLNITVNGVVYSREYTIGGYTSWKDTNGNLVYTDATAEPAVGTVVYSDQGTTQVGTVSEAA